MRLWLDPDRLASSGSPRAMWPTRSGSRTCRPPPGRSASRPSLPGQQFQYTVTTRGRLSTPAEFERHHPPHPGRRLGAARRATSPAWSWAPRATGPSARVGGKPAALIGIFQLPGANALDVPKGVQAAVELARAQLPARRQYARRYDTTEFVTRRSRGRADPRHAIGLVVLVVFVFLRTGAPRSSRC